MEEEQIGAERIEWSRAPDLGGVEALVAERCTRRWHVFHETFTLCTLLDISGGETVWTYRGKLNRAKAGASMLMEPGEVHAMPHEIPPCNFRVLFIKPAVMENAAAELGLPSSMVHWRSGHSADPEVYETFASLSQRLESQSSALERESYFVAGLKLLLERCSEWSRGSIGGGRSGLLRARDYIREHYASRITLTELAQVAGMNRFHLVRAFAKAFGLPPHKYQVLVQLSRARTLMGTGLRPIEAAAEAGFADQSHMTRHFKLTYGITPGRFAAG
jgi:AraC-like DNA-binding protein